MPKETSPIAVLGTGSIGMKHLAMLRELNVPSIAIPTRKKRREQLEHRGHNCADSLAEAIEANVVGIVIATETKRHVADVEHALRSGFHVLCEKPLAASFTEAAHLPGLAKHSGKKLFTALCLRFDAGLKRVKVLLEEFGPIHAVQVECRSYLPDWRPERDYLTSYSARLNEGGVLLDLIHEIDYSQWLFGMPSTVFGQLTNTGRLGIESEEMASIQWSYQNPGSRPMHVNICLDYLTHKSKRSVRIYGENGQLEYDFLKKQIVQENKNGDTHSENIDVDTNAMYRSQILAFVASIEGRKETRLVDAEQGLLSLKLSDSIRQSSEQKSIIEVNQ